MSSVARRYAKALFALAREPAVLDATAEQLARLAAVMEDPSVAAALRSPFMSLKRRGELATSLADELALSDLVTRFVRLAADRQRLAEMPAIATHYQRLLDDALGRVRITVRTAAVLEPALQARVIEAFSKLTGKQALAQVVLDPDLLGGIVVEAEGKVYDGSVRTHLDRLAKTLTGSGSL